MVAQRLMLCAARIAPAIGGVEFEANEIIKRFDGERYPHIVCVCTIKHQEIAYRGNIRAKESPQWPVPVLELPLASTASPEYVIGAIKEAKLIAGDVIFFNDLYWVKIFPAIRENFPYLTMVFKSGGTDVAMAYEGVGETIKERQDFIVTTLNTTLDHVFVCNQFCFGRLAALGVREDIIHIVNGGVDLSLFYPATPKEKATLRRTLGLPTSGTIILNACRFVQFKGLLDLVEAVAIVARTHDVYLVLVGDGPEKQHVMDRAKELGINARVIFPGVIASDAMPPYYRAADIFCSTPIIYTETHGGEFVYTETMGRTFCEAAACGLSAVGTRVGGVPETVREDHTALLCDAGDVQKIAQNIERLLVDTSLREQLGTNGRVWAEELSWEKVFDTYMHVLRL